MLSTRNYSSCGFWGTLIWCVFLITAIISFMNGCIPSLEGTCPSYIHTTGELIGFQAKNASHNHYDVYGIFKSGPITCNAILYDKQPRTIHVSNITTFYDYSIGSNHELFVYKKHITHCVIDFGFTERMNTIFGIIIFICVGIVPIVILWHMLKPDLISYTKYVKQAFQIRRRSFMTDKVYPGPIITEV